MASRLLKMILLCTAGIALSSEAWAQGPAMNGYGPPEQVHLPTWNDLEDPNHWNQLPLGTGQPVASGYSQSSMAPPMLPPHMQPMGPGHQPGMSYHQGSTVTSRAADYTMDDPWDQPSEFERFLGAVVKNSWFRADYLLWSMDGPGNKVVGNPLVSGDLVSDVVISTDNVFDSREYFTWYNLADDDVTVVPFAVSRALDLEGISFSDKSGFRGTLGVPLTSGEFQISSFIVGQAADNVYGTDIPAELGIFTTGPRIDLGYVDYVPLPKYYNLPVTVNGQIASPIAPQLVYDEMRIRMTNNVWGGDAKYLIDLPNQKQYGLVARPLVGAMYLAIHENISTDAIRDNRYNVWATTGELHMSQDSFNNIYGATLGLNLEFRHEYFTLGVEPKGLIGFNTYRTRVRTEDLAFDGEKYSVQETKTEYSPLIDLQVYARAHLTERFSVFFGYDLKYAMKVARPANQTRYNVIGTSDETGSVAEQTDFSISSSLDQFKVDGLTIGGEFRFH
ncbi:BBP7 family outer membrane beta-barrel protein [Polystyrenella longa]|nr:BBP7 family outer membrane beta-barrel protein [Polystyrenella longa]